YPVLRVPGDLLVPGDPAVARGLPDQRLVSADIGLRAPARYSQRGVRLRRGGPWALHPRVVDHISTDLVLGVQQPRKYGFARLCARGDTAICRGDVVALQLDRVPPGPRGMVAALGGMVHPSRGDAHISPRPCVLSLTAAAAFVGD